jgi:hypothetical protein
VSFKTYQASPTVSPVTKEMEQMFTNPMEQKSRVFTVPPDRPLQHLAVCAVSEVSLTKTTISAKIVMWVHIKTRLAKHLAKYVTLAPIYL